MNTKVFLIVGVIAAAVIIVGTAFSFRSSREGSGLPPAGLVIGTNAIYVAEQAPSRTIAVAVVHLEKPGFVVIHEDVTGAPGGILGASGALPAGETNNLASISLSRPTRDGETLYAMLHLDDGDGVFNAAKDKPALDSAHGFPVMMIFTVSAGATEPGAVSL